MEIENFPSKSVEVPVKGFRTATFAPITVSPDSSSITVPRILPFCADRMIEAKRKNKVKSFFIALILGGKSK